MRTIKITEKQFDIINETTNNSFVDNIFDISKITREEAALQFVDYQTQEPVGFTILQNEKNDIKEEIKSSQPLEQVKSDLVNKYDWKDWQFKIINGANKIELALLIPDLNQNVSIVQNDMHFYGYFQGFERDKKIAEFPYKELRFEPFFQESERNTVINMGVIYHSTHNNNINSIMQNGLIPSSKNKLFNYPNRTYFSKFTNNLRHICDITKQLANVSGRNVFDYSILFIDTKKIPDNVDFFFDPIYENGIFTQDIIPSNCIFNIVSFEEVAKFCGYMR